MASLVAQLYGVALDAAEVRAAGGDDRWMEAELDRLASELLRVGLTAKQVAEIVVGAYQESARHHRRRVAANRRRRARR